MDETDRLNLHVADFNNDRAIEAADAFDEDAARVRDNAYNDGGRVDDDGDGDDCWEADPVHPDPDHLDEERQEVQRWASYIGKPKDLEADKMEMADWDSRPHPDYYLTDAELWAKYPWSLQSSLDTEHDHLMRREHWRRLDREWCFMCHHRPTTGQLQSNMHLAKLIGLLTTNFHSQSLDVLARQIQNHFFVEVRQLLPKRDNDPLTRAPRPPFYWHLKQIKLHLTEHVPSVAYAIESRFRSQTKMVDKLLDCAFKRNKRTREIKPVPAVVKLLNDSMRLELLQYRYVTTVRKANGSKI